MNESGKYEVYRKKLDGICEENGLTYALRTSRYPCTLTIKPLGGMEAQISMLEDNDASYISPDASIALAYIDGDLSLKMSETFTISDALLSKIKRLFKNLYAMWTQFFFRDVLSEGCCSTESSRPLQRTPGVRLMPLSLRPQTMPILTSFSRPTTRRRMNDKRYLGPQRGPQRIPEVTPWRMLNGSR